MRSTIGPLRSSISRKCCIGVSDASRHGRALVPGLSMLAQKGNLAELSRARKRLASLDPNETWDEEALAGSLIT